MVPCWSKRGAGDVRRGARCGGPAAVVDEGLNHRQATRWFGIDRRTVKMMLSFEAPVRRPKLEGLTGVIDVILEADLKESRKQRHTVRRVFERPRDEHGLVGGHTIVKDLVRARRQSTHEVFVPLHHPPGHAPVDIGEAAVEVGGRPEKVALVSTILPHSNCNSSRPIRSRRPRPASTGTRASFPSPAGFRDRFHTITRRLRLHGQSLKAPNFRQRDGHCSSR